ncbi:putative bifunctional diguanylate cyclase/phosphodiesterase [Gemmatimonas sp.]|uniref:putative bifunctional diguanylate cyclase/phosphodiesterase n=1 Tax=Gemmatimonas sp. TaxID=1962908 RepID=UPI003562017A
MHPYVLRQLRRHGATEMSDALRPILTSVSALLHDVDRERELSAAAMMELSRELESRYEGMQQSEQRYRLLFAESPMAMFAITRDDRRIIAWNHAAETTFGHVEKDVLNLPVERLELFGAAYCQLTPMIAANVPLPKCGVPTEATMYTLNGRELDAEVMFHTVVLKEHDAVIVHVRDVTVERASIRARAESEARFRAFFESAGIAIHVLSFDGIILEANPASQDLLGYPPSEVVGRPAVSLSPEEDIESGRELGQELRTGMRDSVTVERRFFHKEGHIVWGQLTVSRVTHGVDACMIGMIQDITQRKSMEGQLIKQAFQDDLTGLANRALFRDRLRLALDRRSRANSRVAVLVLDLDGFKRVNDSLGHAVGDELLQIVGRRIASTVRSGETVARLGGDEFSVVLDAFEQTDDPDKLAERLLRLLRMPMRIGGREVVVGVSIGIAIADPTDDEETLLRNADTAMYAAKSSGKACVRRFDPAMRREAMEWLELESDLRMGVDRHEFFLLFQPLIRIDSGRVKGFEALIRWQHPERGDVRPGLFIPIAEETGLIIPIGRWVLMEACMQAARWTQFSDEAPSVSVNVAAKQLDADTLIEDTLAALQISKLDPRRLILEITESDIMRTPELALEKLKALKALGVKLAIDDFGTGYSSLSHLQYFPVDELKIDRSFVARIRDGDRESAFVRTIVSLAKSMNVDVVAEGVEEAEQQQFLYSIGCDFGQGYLYSRPLPANEVEAFVTHSALVLPMLAASTK